MSGSSANTLTLNSFINPNIGLPTFGSFTNPVSSISPGAIQQGLQQAGITGSSAPAPSSDAGLRAVLRPLHPEDIYDGALQGGIMDPINSTGTNGMIFPYTPTISFSQAVNYTDLQLVHSNTDYPAYTRTPTCTLSVNGKFTVQNQQEGLYVLAALHYLRVASKSYFGETDAAKGKAGLPPPVLLFSAYGQYVFNKLRVVLKSHSYTFDDSVDTVSVRVKNATVRLPTLLTIQTELMVVQTPQRMRKQFSFDDFATGKLMDSDGGWI